MIVKSLLAGFTVAVLAASNANAASYGILKTSGDKNLFQPVFTTKASALKKADSGEFQIAGYDEDFSDCSNIAERQSEGSSDSVYLGYFYGCMSQRGYSN